MADQQVPAAAQPAQAAAQPAQTPQIGSGLPDGYQPISKADYERLTRYEQQVRGFQPLYEKLTKSGIKSADDWANYEPIVNTARQRKIDAKAFSAMFSDEAERDLSGNGAQNTPPPDVAKLREELRNEIMGDVYTMRHEDARKGDSGIIEKAIAKVLGDGEHDDFNKELTKRAVKDWLEENRPTYPDGHPLAGKYLAPLTQELADKVAEYMTGLKAKQAGKDLSEKARDAATPRPQGTVGGGGNSGTGKPTINNKDRFSNKPTDDEIGAEIAKAAARRGR